MKISKFPIWHANVAKLQQLLACQTINMACVVPSAVVVCNEKGVFKVEGSIRQWY
jgi:hypothetical protein